MQIKHAFVLTHSELEVLQLKPYIINARCATKIHTKFLKMFSDRFQRTFSATLNLIVRGFALGRTWILICLSIF